ncbi:hypothetical protein P3H80_12070 [Mycolicibacterium septicum]|uniref:hypothetical protein n=1 Tax=Mycolicibacterium septicum TaxID=98668 RepID=UPI0023E2E397|nr:hypothetical protein [Mycolicibacterium septicum]MDF3338164.1 hypothetical protein [Mycolicibacterium septicum]
MSYPDPYHPQQQPPPGPYPPAPPGSQGYGYPPNGGYPPAQAYQPYGAPQQPPYYPQPAVTPQPDANRDDGNSRIWRILDNLMFFASDSASQGLGKNPRDRVKTGLTIIGVALVGIVILVLVVVLMSK